ncbi:MAG TPA: MFS transporter [Pyrinomonadaceae bacterium]|nr:MFS transporter [Pyrinomonadaceae bacterium]
MRQTGKKVEHVAVCLFACPAKVTVQNEISSMLFTRRWLLVAPALLLWWIVGQIDKSNISFVIIDSRFLDQLHLNGRYSELGSLLSAFFLGYGASIFVWGFVVDRFGARVCLLSGTLAWALIMFLMSRATTFQELWIARFMLGVAEGNMWPVSNLLTNRWFPSREHARAQAFWMMGPTLGTALGVPLVIRLLATDGWSEMMQTLAFISLVPLVAFLFVADSHDPANSGGHERFNERNAGKHRSQQAPLKEILANKAFWLITLGMILSGATIFTLVQWTPSFLTEQRGLARQSMNFGLTFGYLLATALTLFFGAIADRTMNRALTAAAASFIFAVLIVPSALVLSPWASAVALAGLITVPCVVPALNGALLHGMIQPEFIARATGIYSGIGGIVAAAGPWIFGRLVGLLGGEYWGGFMFLALLNLLSAAVYFFLQRQPTKQNYEFIAQD